MKRYFWFILLLILGTACTPESAKSPVAENNTQAQTPAITANTVIIDVRTEAEFASGHHEKALNIPLDIFQQQISTAVPDKNTPVLLYCRSGRRAGIALEQMQALGYTQAQNAINLETLNQLLQGN